MKKITIIGTGYVGLVSGAGLADFGNDVTCLDINLERIKILLEGKIPFFEPGLSELVERNVDAKRLHFSTDFSRSINDSEVIFIAVGTPMNSSGISDISAVKKVAIDIAQNISSSKVVAIKSTVPIGTCVELESLINSKLKKNVNVHVVSNPEFLREGAAVRDFLIPDRVVIGSSSKIPIDIMKEVYRPLFLNETPQIITNLPTAETIKYASNSFLAVKISFINEIANLCDEIGADVHVVARAMGLDGRISPKFLHPGPGFGGSCFPKDTEALINVGKQNNVDLKVVKAASDSNKIQIKKIIQKLDKHIKNYNNKKIGILGLAFKANTDDVRESKSIDIIKYLISNQAEIAAYDPAAIENMRNIFPNVNYKYTIDEVVKNASAILIMTDWNEFRGLDLQKAAKIMKEKIIVDARNLLSREDLFENNFIFEGVGRPFLKNYD
tara:strand:+ start:15340 stop:16662 length:1323 start_codon:yes stop_codon:yes gene_type:complete